MSAPPSTFHVINCSLHLSDKNFKLDIFKSRVYLLKSLGYSLCINLVGHPDQIMLADECARWTKNIGISFSLIPLIGDINGISFRSIEDYPEPLKRVIKKYSHITLVDKNRFNNGERIDKLI